MAHPRFASMEVLPSPGARGRVREWLPEARGDDCVAHALKSWDLQERDLLLMGDPAGKEQGHKSASLALLPPFGLFLGLPVGKLQAKARGQRALSCLSCKSISQHRKKDGEGLEGEAGGARRSIQCSLPCFERERMKLSLTWMTCLGSQGEGQ